MIQRWRVLVGILCLLSAGSVAHAEDSSLDDNRAIEIRSLYDVGRMAKASKKDTSVSELDDLFADVDDELELLVDYHPTVDRWTETNNRIRVTLYTGAWFYSGELDIKQNIMFGARVSWEVPGFIAIHFDLAHSPYSRLEVKPGADPSGRSSRHAWGSVTTGYVSVAIFNPELSSEKLAFWAGVGLGFYYQDFRERSVQNNVFPTKVESQELTPSSKVFIELDYKISDTLHVGGGIATHFVYADFTDDGRHYDVNGVQGGVASGGRLTQSDRNRGILGDFAVITELTLNISVVF